MRQAVSVRRFHDLIPHRVQEILLVSSPYDAFILQEDGHLTEKMFSEYRQVSLAASPRFTHVPNGEEAIRSLEERHFDLILTMTSLADMDVEAFGRRVKKLYPRIPFVLLALERTEAVRMSESVPSELVDGVFLWTGDMHILLAAIKSCEDRMNVEHDVRHGNLRVIIFVEDSVFHYSSFLGFLYSEMMRQSLSLYSEGPSELYRHMYMKTRPKVLHARSYEEAHDLFMQYRSNILALISDIGIPRNGKLDPSAGLDFARFARQQVPELSLLLQSAEAQNREHAEEMQAAFIDKNSPRQLQEIREFLSFRLGFGDFIFRSRDGVEFDRARDLREMEEKLAVVPEELVLYHASNNHISLWLMARSEFELAERLRPKKVSDFKSIEHCRQHVIESLRESRQRHREGVIADFRPDQFEQVTFSRLGTGSLGGKARGIAFLYQTLAELGPSDFGGLDVKIPQSVVVTTDPFDEFMEVNDLRGFVQEGASDRQIVERFEQAQLPESLRWQLEILIDHMVGPLAIRSSSLLEDSMHQPFAGIYSTLMIRNCDSGKRRRLLELCNSIKMVYASTFFENARAYMHSAGSRIEEEKMAVIIQRLVGQQHSRRFYPSFSGVAYSHNYYPIGPQKPEDGVVHVALGLGRQIVDGGRALRFSPRHPRVNPEFAVPERFLDTSQRGFWALDMEHEMGTLLTDLYATLQYFPLEAAEEDGSLAPIGSVYSAADEQIRDDLSLEGPRLITFNNILKHRAIPLPEALRKALDITERGMGCGVEVEFACSMGDWGKWVGRGEERRNPELHLLQVRPLVGGSTGEKIEVADLADDDLLCRSLRSLGHGGRRDLLDVIYVRPDRWEASRNRAIAREVGLLNHALAEEKRPYLLIGPGRWGTQDHWLGIPVTWAQISGARVIIEASPEGYNVDPSQGTHFFHNITSLGIGYMTLPPGASKERAVAGQFLDWEWLDQMPALNETESLRHLRLESPLIVTLDGKKGRGLVGKPKDSAAG